MPRDTPPSPKDEARIALRDLQARLRAGLSRTAALAGNGINLLLAVAVAAAIYLAFRQTGTDAALPPSEPLPVEVETVARQDSFRIVERFAGRIEADRRTVMSFDRPGRLVEIRADEGDVVARGDVLAGLDTRSLLAERRRTIAERDGIDARIERARLNLDRVLSLAERGVASQQNNDDARISLKEAEATRREVEARLASIDLEIEKAKLTAPFAGEVAVRHADEGQVVAAGAPVLTLVETAAPLLRVGLPEPRAALLRPGQPVEVRYRGAPVAARVESTLPDLDRVTQAVLVRIALSPGPGQSVQIGDTAELVLQTDVPGPGFDVPLAALAEGRRGLWTVYALGEDGTVGTEALEVIALSGERAFVRGSLRAGQRIVASGRHRVVPGQRAVPAGRPAGDGGS